MGQVTTMNRNSERLCPLRVFMPLEGAFLAGYGDKPRAQAAAGLVSAFDKINILTSGDSSRVMLPMRKLLRGASITC